MSTFDKYQRTTESVKDHTLEENRRLTRQLAESRQSFELLKFVHFDKTINLDTLNDIIVGCTGCLYAFMYYLDHTITNLNSNHAIYQSILTHKKQLLSHGTLYVDGELIPNHTIVVYPVSTSQMISNESLIDNIILIYPSKFVTDEALEFVKNFMIVNDVLINIVLMREKMYELIETDPLTRLLNRSSWNSSLELIVRKGEPFFIIFIDIDNFKVLNDTLGHQKGDEVLKVGSAWLKNAFGLEDKVFRLGGDEFAVTGKVNMDTIEGHLHKIENLNISYRNTIKTFLNIDSSISIGALLTEKPKDIEAVYTRVDALLYESKEMGRNQVHIVSDF